MQNWLALAGFVLGLFTSLAGALAWYATSVRKRYAAERDFQHLKRNYEQLAANQGVMLSNFAELDSKLGDIHEAIADMDARMQWFDIPKKKPVDYE